MEPFTFRPHWLSRLTSSVFVGRYHAEERHPVSRNLIRAYEPACRFVLRHPKAVIAAALAIVALSFPVFFKLGSEFMPPLNEGTILFMPTTLPGASIAQAEQLLATQDQVLASFPEVERVFGKAGRADTSTDPAPFSMGETTVVLKPEAEWRAKPRWYSSWSPSWLKPAFRPFWPDHLSWDELVAEMDTALRLPGVNNAWTMPIKARIDMLSTGVRTPVGVKVFGSDLSEIERVGEHLEQILGRVRGTRSVYAERVAAGSFVDIVPRRDQLARYGLTIDQLQMVIGAAIGGENVTTTIEGRERYPVNVRYPRELRDDLGRLGRVLVPTSGGAQLPLSQLADLRIVQGPAMLRDENGFLTGYVYVDVAGRDVGSYVEEAKRAVAQGLVLPKGYSLSWSGQYENMQRVKERLKVVVPITLALIFILLYINTRSPFKAGLVMLAVPFSAVGALWLFYFLGYNVSIAAWVGMIALLGLDAETGVFMLLFLDLSYDEANRRGLLRNEPDLDEAIVHGAVKRARPKMMTVCAAFMGLLPILWSTSAGADVMKRIAAPMIGGLATSFLLELLVYPAVYKLWKRRSLPGDQGITIPQEALPADAPPDSWSSGRRRRGRGNDERVEMGGNLVQLLAQPFPVAGGNALAHAATRFAATAELLVEEAPAAVVDGSVGLFSSLLAEGIGDIDLGEQLHRRIAFDGSAHGGPVGQLAVSGFFPVHDNSSSVGIGMRISRSSWPCRLTVRKSQSAKGNVNRP
jgi:copper/silver efflux system protein